MPRVSARRQGAWCYRLPAVFSNSSARPHDRTTRAVALLHLYLTEKRRARAGVTTYKERNAVRSASIRVRRAPPVHPVAMVNDPVDRPTKCVCRQSMRSSSN